MHEIFNMLLAVFDRAALMLICLFFLIRIRLFRELLHKSAHSPKELLAVTAIFSLFALFSTWSGVPVEGSLVNVRIIAVMSGGILFGPWVGIITGVIAGIHRYLIDIGGVTAIPCFITSILAGCISGWINLKIPKAQRWRVGILGGMLCETLTMILVIVWAPTTALGIDIVSKIGIPMILGSVCIGFIVLLVQSVEGEKEASAARQAKLALDIANKTLPLFRHVNSESLRKVCEIIRDDIHADAVAITNTDHVLAYVGVGEHNYQNGDDFISPTTRQAMNYGKIIIKNNDEAHRTPEIHSMLVIPLWEKGVVTGTLKIYYCHAHQITSSLQEMAVGLSQIISTQLEVSRAEQLREMANKAELRALQSKINPHFLFNALNAISSSIRLNPDTARQIQLPSLQRGEGEAMLTALTHLSRSPLEQNIIQPLVLSLLHLCRNVVNMPPGNSQPRGDFLYHSICNWVQDNYAQPLTRESVAQFFNITPNHLSKLFAQHGTMRFIEYVRWVRMAKARMILQKYHLSIHEVAQRCGFPDSDYFCRVFRRQFGLTPGEYSARFQG